MVLMTEAQYQDIEQFIEQEMRARHHERASRMMNLALGYKFAKPAEPPLPSNVVEMEGWSKKASA